MKFLEQAMPDTVSIADLLHKALTVVEPGRKMDILHASALTNSGRFCPREVVISTLLDRMTMPQKIDAPMTVTFHEGKDKQHRLNNDWLRPIMVGAWDCLCGNSREWGKVPVGCVCGFPRWRYREIVFFHSTGARGSLDAIIDVGKTKLRLLEFKIMDKDLWIDLKAPLAEHRVRSKLYLEIIDGSAFKYKNEIDLERIHVVYCMRGFGKQDKDSKNPKRITPFKEFIVHKDYGEVKLYLDMAIAVQKARAANWKEMPNGICETMFDKRCGSCSVPKECFSGLYPATFGW